MNGTDNEIKLPREIQPQNEQHTEVKTQSEIKAPSETQKSITLNQNISNESQCKSECNKRNTTTINTFLANTIWVFHMLVVAFVVLAPLTQVPALHILHITFSLSLLVHWYCNSNVCSLSMIESKLRGLDYTESFTHRIVAPIYDISKTTWSKLCYTVTSILLCISIYKLIHSPKWKQAWEAYNQKYQQFNDATVNTDWYTRMIAYVRCFEPLFMLC